MKFFKKKILKAIAVFLALNFVTQVVFPTVALALTSGPAQPEFSSFEPVATTNMVNDFTGEFTYNLPVINVPGPNGSGYSASLSYHSGSSVEEEASWVGYGWTLNPGSINRGVQGIPDDYNGTNVNDKITYYNTTPKNWTATAGLRAGLEIYSIDSDGSPFSMAKASLSHSVRYNNYRGYGIVNSVSVGAFGGVASLNYSVSGEDGHSFDFNINPAAIITAYARTKAKKIDKKLDEKANQENLTQDEVDQMISNIQKRDKNQKLSHSHILSGLKKSMASTFGLHSFADDNRPTNVHGYSGSSTDVSINFAGDPTPFHIGLEGGAFGSYTEQTSNSFETRNAYGFMYLDQSINDGNKVMDYSVEKEAHYNKRDRFLPVPIQRPDMFSVSGEGVAGGFKLYSKSVGHFQPAYNSSTINIGNEGYEVTVGGNLEFAGFNVGTGTQTLLVNDWNDLVGNWNDPGNHLNYKFSNSEYNPYFFRYTNDLGGNVEYSSNDAPYRADIKTGSAVPGFKTFAPVIKDIYRKMNSASTSNGVYGIAGKSSFIGYHTNSEMANDYTYFKSITRNNTAIPDDTWDMVARDASNSIKDRIGEIYTVNDAGNRFVYGLPVFNADEKNYSYSIDNNYTSIDQSNYLIYKDINGFTNSKVGEEKNAPYSSLYLLTEITTPDYIDRQLDGPTTDDFGGWTKFGYRPVYYQYDPLNPSVHASKDNRSNWYKWRMPYNGLYYNKGDVSDPRDDMGYFRSGTKEIYYLKQIETKTHIAFFVTNKSNYDYPSSSDPNKIHLQGSQNLRTDGLDAANDNNEDQSTSDKGTHGLEQLEKIVLYAKDENGNITGKPLKIVRFEYYPDNQSLVKNLPNSSTAGGKLTLKKVWFEYEGIVNAKTTPYEFIYEYKVGGVTASDLTTKYSSIINYRSELVSADQNPDYHPAKLDGWGGYLYDGINRFKNYTPWIYQGMIPLAANYDPAAWQLKRIKLPSGGEILVQYEQHDYKYVQDQEALTMVSLTADDGTNNGFHDETTDIPDPNQAGKSIKRYYINISDVDLDVNEDRTVSAAEISNYKDKLLAYIQSEKVFFKFLYTLSGDDQPDINHCSADFIEGYTSFENVSLSSDGTKIYFDIASDQSLYNLPRQVCFDHYARNKAGLHNYYDCSADRGDLDNAGAGKVVLNLVGHLFNTYDANPSTDCKKISLSNSYLRLPLMKGKKAGGVRVKRILMYDAGLETGDESFYGTEYSYKNEDGSSSGVATNEPAPYKEENSLVKFLDKRAPQTWLQRVVSGKDKDNFEGPMGESLLPSPSIGYSRVIAKNIHTGKTGTGFKVTEFYTCKDYPIKMSFTEIDDHATDWFPIPGIWVNLNTDNLWRSQGYSFILNAMHGKLKRIATYGGDYTVPGCTKNNTTKSFEEIHEYFAPGEKVPVMDETGSIGMAYMGKDMEVTMERKVVSDITDNLNVQIDFDVALLFIPLPMGSFFPTYTYGEKELRTHTISKVISYPAIEKKVTTVKDGIVHISENKVFSKFNGTPIATVSYDGFDGLTLPQPSSHTQKGAYTSYSIPASYVYKEMGQKGMNEGFSFNIPASVNLVQDVTGTYFNLPAGNDTLISKGYLVAGDLIKLTSSNTKALYHIDGFASNNLKINLQPFSLTTSISTGATLSKLEVVSSGYTNQLNATVGNIITYGNDYSSQSNPPSPLSVSGQVYKQNDLTKVLTSTAQLYSDKWTNSNSDYNISGTANDFEAGRRGKWRLLSNYAYKDNVKDGVSGNNKIYSDAGTIATLTGFKYKDGTVNGPINDNNLWLNTTTITSYSPNGNALEERNILGVYSSAKFGYKESVPVLIAQNAPKSSVNFISFEDDVTASSTYAHSGSRSYNLNSNTTYSAGNVLLDKGASQVDNFDQIRKKGLLSRFWIKTPDNYPDVASSILCYVDNGSLQVNGTVQQIARVGEWTLVEAKFINAFGVYPAGSSLTVKIKNLSYPVYLDDIRVQPYDSEMTCYVYDKNNLRLITTFDDQHFGMYYQYNAEGQLVRKLVETEKGIKTISETLYNTATN